MKPGPHDPFPPDEGSPPIMGTWRRFYWLVIVLHALFILGLYLLTQWYS